MLDFTRNELLKVQKPARYLGGEYNQVIKNKNNIKCRFAFCFPDVYDIGMSNIAIKILYKVLNDRKDTWCERAFAPWPDFETLLRKKNVLLYGLESKDPIKDFDIIGFTLQYEMSYTNILNMLDLAGVPIFSKDRNDKDPFVLAGGPCACNPYPLSKFIDVFMLGDGEELIDTLVKKQIKWKESGKSRKEFLESIKDIQGIFIPSIHTKKDKIKKALLEDMDKLKYPTDFVVPNVEIVQNRIALEVFRGCSRGCRFCQAGYIYRPVREKSVERLSCLAKESIKNTGLNEIALTSLSTSDYSEFNKLANSILEIGKEKKVDFSLPSLRIDSVNLDLLNKVQQVRKSSLTFAPEAGSQRLRNVINKNITEEEILSGCKMAFENGWNSVKLYFMIGLPTETFDDLEEIVMLANKIVDTYYSVPKEKRNGRCMITVSTSTFVPKPHTPFEWCGQDDIRNIALKQKYLMDRLKNKNIKYSWYDPYISRLEATISRGDEKIADVIYSAFKNGAKFDSWDEQLNKDAWNKAFKENDLDIDEYAMKSYPEDHEFPWDNIMHGVEKSFLLREYKKAMNLKTTPRCSLKCAGCGVNLLGKCKFLEEHKKSKENLNEK